MRKPVRAVIEDVHRQSAWLVIGALCIGVFALGFVGFTRRAALVGEELGPLDAAYLTLQLFALESGAVAPPVPVELQISRLLAPIVTAVTALRALLMVLGRGTRWRRDHVVVCGLGQKGSALARRFAQKGGQVVIIEKDRNNESLAEWEGRRGTVIIGDATVPDFLRRASAGNARHVFAVTGDDCANAEIAVQTAWLAERRQEGAVTCVVHTTQPDLAGLLTEFELSAEASKSFRLQFFNIHESGARVLLARHPFLGDEYDVRDLRAHVLIVGFGRLGRAVLTRIGRRWLPRRRALGKRLPVTVVGDGAEGDFERLALQYVDLREACDVNAASLAERGDVTIAYVCIEDDSLCVHAAMSIDRMAREWDKAFPIVAVLSRERGLVTLLRKRETTGFGNIKPFGLLERTCAPSLLASGAHESLARALHEEHVRQQAVGAGGDGADPRLARWEDLPEELREASRRRADHIRGSLKAVGCDLIASPDWDPAAFRFTQEEGEVVARMEHRRWMRDHLLQGWTVGPVDDTQEKTSPNLVRWSRGLLQACLPPAPAGGSHLNRPLIARHR
ncbi:MAG: potassium channel family protein [Planctomycetota bacterium]|jgi:voltage-gated potassium channel Kch